MKKIYMLTLDDEVPLLGDTGNNVREIAYLLYQELIAAGYVLDSDTDRITINQLNEIFRGNGYTYRFLSEESPKDYRDYEPFIVDGKSFGFTVEDGSLDEDTLLAMLCYVLGLAQFAEYRFRVKSAVYNEKIYSNRYYTIDRLISDGVETTKKSDNNKKSRVLFPRIASFL